jgi:UDPglucose 6-dehydrogenase
MQVCVIGTGYVGLVTGVCLAQIGHQVICVDNDVQKVKLMQSGQSPMFEPGLAQMMTANMQAGRLEFTADLKVGVERGEILFKYAANAFLATKISFINEVGNICDRVGADVTLVAKGIGLDTRIGHKFLQAGIGWGGSCFPKDVSALVHTATDYGYDAQLLKATIETNRQQRLIAIDKLQQVLKILKGKTIGLLGLTFKPDTDDLRDAPALDLIDRLTHLGAKVKAYDPLIKSDRHHPDLAKITLTADAKDLASGCDALVLVTEWQEFQQLDYAHLASLMARPTIVDGRNYLDARALATAGFDYIGIGRPRVDRFTPSESLPTQIDDRISKSAA